MKFSDKKMEIVIRLSPNGDFSIESNTRENVRVFSAVQYVARRLKAMMNSSKKNALCLPSGHLEQYERN